MAKPVVEQFLEQGPGVLIGEMAGPAFDALLEVPGVGAVDQHLGIMVGLQAEQGAVPEVLPDHGGGDAQVGGDADFGAVSLKGKPRGFLGVMGGGKGAQGQGADSAAVVFDALQSARARGIDVLIADTAGRLHTQDHLMAELGKIRRVMSRIDPDAPHEVMLVVDAGTGQNALVQAQQFNKAVQLTGITVTKLDGTARGGIVFAIAEAMQLPIRFIGVGERAVDLRPFDAGTFVHAVLPVE